MLKVINGGFEPVRATKYSAYVDLFAREDIVIGAGETKIVKLGVKIDLEKLQRNQFYSETIEDTNFFLKSHYLEVALRSSLGAKGLIIANGIGIVDLDYPDEIGLIVYNPITNSWNENFADGTVDFITHLHNGADKKMNYKINKGDKVCQCCLKEHKSYLMGYESENIRIGGYGSTGK